MDLNIVLPNGECVCVNGAAHQCTLRLCQRSICVSIDHVYSAAPWGLRDSNLAYSIGRVMEFLPAIWDRAKKPAYTPERVRIAWYYRPSDLSERSTDSRLLLAAIYSEVQPISYIRGKCYVRHRDMIVNLSGWKKQPDCFYFYRFFDPYIKKEYEVLLSRDVNNRAFSLDTRFVRILANLCVVPANVKATLMERYQFIVAEKEIVPDLIDALRTCDTCSEWCSP
jgi:hypothetical protein